MSAVNRSSSDGQSRASKAAAHRTKTSTAACCSVSSTVTASMYGLSECGSGKPTIAIATRFSPGGRLKKLDRIAGRVIQHDLLTARTAHDIAAEVHTSSTQPCHLGLDIFHNQMEPVPASWSGLAAVRHRTPRRTGRSGQQQPQVAACDVCERGGSAKSHGKTEIACIEGDSGFHVVHHVPHAHQVRQVVGHVNSPLLWTRSVWPRRDRNKNRMRLSSSTAVSQNAGYVAASVSATREGSAMLQWIAAGCPGNSGQTSR